MAKKKTVPEELDELWRVAQEHRAAVNEVREYCGLQLLGQIKRDSALPLFEAGPGATNNGQLSQADLHREPNPPGNTGNQQAARATPEMGGKGGTAVNSVNSVFPSGKILISAERPRSERPLTAVPEAPDEWNAIARVLRMYGSNVLGSKRGATREQRQEIGVRTVIRRGREILPRMDERRRNWICGAILFCHRNPSRIGNAIRYLLSAVESVRTGGEPCPDEYFRDAEALFLDEKAPRTAVKGSIGDILKGHTNDDIRFSFGGGAGAAPQDRSRS